MSVNNDSAKQKEKKIGWRLVNWRMSLSSPRPIFKKLAAGLESDLKMRLKQISRATDSFPLTEAWHLAIDNLSNVKILVEKLLGGEQPLTGESALALLNAQIEQTRTVCRSETLSQSAQAGVIAVRTLNLLFAARQALKQKFSVVSPLAVSEPMHQKANFPAAPEEEKSLLLSGQKQIEIAPAMIIDSTLLYQLHYSLFPAERMLVGAGKKTDRQIEIEGIFDVTGQAGSGYVKADANRLARALIAMSETDKYFAFWIHSHPGRGREMTRPSKTDLNQEIEWLKDYSQNLVNAIMVEDRYVRFWGKALDEKRITVTVRGNGIKKEPESENLYRLEF